MKGKNTMQFRAEDPRNQVVRAHAQLNQAGIPSAILLTTRLGQLLDGIDNVTMPLLGEGFKGSTLAKVNIAGNLAVNLTMWLDFKGLRKEAVEQAVRLVMKEHPDTKESFLWLPGETPEHILEQINTIFQEGHEDAASELSDTQNVSSFEFFIYVIDRWHNENGGSLGAWLNEQRERPQGLAHLYLHWKEWQETKQREQDVPVEIDEFKLHSIDLTPEGWQPAISLKTGEIILPGSPMSLSDPLTRVERDKEDDRLKNGRIVPINPETGHPLNLPGNHESTRYRLGQEEEDE